MTVGLAILFLVAEFALIGALFVLAVGNIPNSDRDDLP